MKGTREGIFWVRIHRQFPGSHRIDWALAQWDATDAVWIEADFKYDFAEHYVEAIGPEVMPPKETQ